MTADTIPFEARRFRTAAAHYLAGRPAYSPRVIARVAELCRLGPTHRLLDLGCGPGQLARAFAPFVAEVVGLDPEPEMLRIARRDAPSNAQWLEASACDISTSLGAFRLATLGRSFHWMERADTLRRLDAIIEPDGAVALFRDSHPELPDNAWRGDFRALIALYAADDAQHGRQRAPGWVPHTAILLDSAFCVLEEIAVIERRTVTADMLVQRVLSMSSTSRARLGDRADALSNDIRAMMQRLAPSDQLVEVVATSALIARRASGAVVPRIV
jgi:SAM-dependent methyltransferase